MHAAVSPPTALNPTLDRVRREKPTVLGNKSDLPFGHAVVPGGVHLYRSSQVEASTTAQHAQINHPKACTRARRAPGPVRPALRHQYRRRKLPARSAVRVDRHPQGIRGFESWLAHPSWSSSRSNQRRPQVRLPIVSTPRELGPAVISCGGRGRIQDRALVERFQPHRARSPIQP